MSGLPRRIWLVGTCGSGKSFVADRLAERLGVPAVHLDELHHLPGWVQVPPEELRAKVDSVTAGPAWVADGNYTSVVRDLRRARAELVVWLDLPFAVTFPRVLRRALVRSFTGELCCNGNRETLSRAFFHRESILWWAIHTHRGRRRRLAADLADLPHVRLRSQREVEAFLAGVRGGGSGAAAD